MIQKLALLSCILVLLSPVKSDAQITFKMTPFGQGKNAIRSSQFSKNSRLLATTNEKNEVIIWDYYRKTALHTFKVPMGYTHFQFAPNGLKFAISKNKNLLIWTINKNKYSLKETAFDGPVQDIAFSPNSRLLTASGSQDNTHKIIFWDLVTNKKISREIRHTHPINKMKWSPNGKYIGGIHTENGNAIIWESKTGKKVASIKPNGHTKLYSIQFGPKNRTVALGGNNFTTYVYKIQSQKLIHTFTGNEIIVPNDSNAVTQIAFTHDNHYLFTANRNIDIWDLSSGAHIAKIVDPFEAQNTLMVHKHNTVLIAGSNDPRTKYVKEWSLSDLDISQKLYNQANHSFNEWSKKYKFETPLQYKKRRQTDTKKYSQIIQESLIDLSSHFKSGIRQLSHNKKKNSVTLKAPHFKRFTIFSDKPTYKILHAHYKDLQINTLSIPDGPSSNPLKDWSILQFKGVIKKSNTIINYTKNAANLRHPDRYSSLKKQAKDIQKQARNGTPNNKAKLALVLMLGDGVDADPPSAITLAQKAANHGSSLGQYVLAWTTHFGLGTDKDPEKARRLFKTTYTEMIQNSKNKIDSTLCYALGTLYEYGFGVTSSMYDATKWYKLSGEQGYHRAQHKLGTFYKTGTHVKQNEAIARQWFHRAADKGSPFAQYEIGLYYLNNDNLKNNIENAALWLHQSAIQNHAEASYKLGMLFKDGAGVTHSDTQSLYWFEQAASLDHSLAQYELGRYFTYGIGTIPNKSIGKKWFKKAIDNGVDRAFIEMGRLQKKPQKAMPWFEKGIKKNIPIAYYELALLLEKNPELRPTDNPTIVQDYITKAAQYGIADAQYLLGIQLQPSNSEMTIKWLEKAAKTGHQNAQYTLGKWFESQKNTKSALFWYFSAAEQNQRKSQLKLAQTLRQKSNFQNKMKAKYWYEKAAETTSPNIQFELAQFLDTKTQSTENKFESLKWYITAGLQGHTDAQARLAERYKTGENAPINPALAQFWLNKSTTPSPSITAPLSESSETTPTSVNIEEITGKNTIGAPNKSEPPTPIPTTSESISTPNQKPDN